jgi:hypothetical protein
VTVYRTPWDVDPPRPETVALSMPSVTKPRGRRPARARPAAPAQAWLYHHLTVTGPTATVAAFATAARGSGVVPWMIDTTSVEEDVFNLAASQPPAHRSLTVEGCRILARQFRDQVEARQARAAALAGHSRACPFDLYTLVPVPAAILKLGPTHPTALAWTTQHWGVSDGLRQVVERTDPRPGRRLAKDHAIHGYGFFTRGDTPHAAIAQLSPRWPTLRLALQPRPD